MWPELLKRLFGNNGQGPLLNTDILPVAPVTKGGTGAATAAEARTNLGAAPLDSPALTGAPTAPTGAPAATTRLATQAYVETRAAALADGVNAAANANPVGTQPGAVSLNVLYDATISISGRTITLNRYYKADSIGVCTTNCTTVNCGKD
ncbi:hypothetical protein FACS189460_3100 [Deltaproteobacteria bacterium]|nr:hypothetical protein FACS189460_3100 [Deltaproteobacteria bacterium]